MAYFRIQWHAAVEQENRESIVFFPPKKDPSRKRKSFVSASSSSSAVVFHYFFPPTHCCCLPSPPLLSSDKTRFTNQDHQERPIVPPASIGLMKSLFLRSSTIFLLPATVACFVPSVAQPLPSPPTHFISDSSCSLKSSSSSSSDNTAAASSTSSTTTDPTLPHSARRMQQPSLFFQYELSITAPSRGCHLITSNVQKVMQKDISQIKMGICHLFIQHTSASLTINENADPDVRRDMEVALNKIVPAEWNRDGTFRHTMEGDDDMPGHVKVWNHLSIYLYIYICMESKLSESPCLYWYSCVGYAPRSKAYFGMCVFLCLFICTVY